MSVGRGSSGVAFVLVLIACASCAHLFRPHDDRVADPSPERPPSVPESVDRSAPEWSSRGQPYVDLTVHTHGSAGGDFDVDVSPDGSWITFSSTRHSSTPGIYLQKLGSGGAIEKTSSAARDIQPKFSPDGQWIAYASDREGNFDIWICATRGHSASWHLTNSPLDEIHPTWSPDGSSIAYCRREANGEWYLWRIDVNSHQRTQIGPGLYPEWSPDGRSLAFQRPSGRGEGWYGIWMVDAEGGAPEEIVTEPTWGTIQPSWAPNSLSLVYAMARAPLDQPSGTPQAEDLWIVHRDGRRFQLTSAPGPDYGPAWGLDGRIYFTSHRGGTPRIVSLRPGPLETPPDVGTVPR